jgi:mevalonate kinase
LLNPFGNKNTMMQSYYAHGKLLLSAEYAVLDGALALALPTLKGQSLQVADTSDKGLEWTSLDWQGNPWYRGRFELSEGYLTAQQPDPVSKRLEQLLNLCWQKNSGFLKPDKGYSIKTQLEFPRQWGLGSSSTLIFNLSRWSGVDPYYLLDHSFGGSGYDLAAAGSQTPLLYQRTQEGPKVKGVQLNWDFTDQLYFIYLNRKQNSREAIKHYRERSAINRDHIDAISDLTRQMVGCPALGAFEELLDRHEAIMSDLLGLAPVKERLFPDYSGSVKSLGGWGGDFVLVTRANDSLEYFNSRGFTTVLPFSEIIL